MDGVMRSPMIGAIIDSRLGKIVVCLLATAGSWFLIFGAIWREDFLPYRIDLDVYRLGGQMVLRGGDLYGRLPDTVVGANLPFTYPPIAAVLFAPFAAMPYWLANLVFSAGTLLCLAVVVYLVMRAVTELKGSRLAWASMAVYSVALWLGPVWETIDFGQINIFLMMLVVVDALAGRGKWWGGSLIGLAMAIKLTPAVFLAFLLVRRDWRALAGAVVSALAATGLGFLFLPEASLRYWTQVLADPSRIGGLAYVSNQSLNGLLVRLGLSEGGGMVWFALCAVIGLALLAVMWLLLKQGHAAAAMLAMAFYALVASPVSWSHHWVWIVPALIVLVAWADRERSTVLWATAWVGAAVFYTRVAWHMPHNDGKERLWTWWQQILGNAQLLWGLGFLVVLALMAWRGRSTTHAKVGAATS